MPLPEHSFEGNQAVHLRYVPETRLSPDRSLSGKRDSNPRPQPWQGCALPTELFPQFAHIYPPSFLMAGVILGVKPSQPGFKASADTLKANGERAGAAIFFNFSYLIQYPTCQSSRLSLQTTNANIQHSSDNSKKTCIFFTFLFLRHGQFRFWRAYNGTFPVLLQSCNFFFCIPSFQRTLSEFSVRRGYNAFSSVLLQHP